MSTRTLFHPVSETAAQQFVALDSPAEVAVAAAIYRSGSMGETAAIGGCAEGLHFVLTGLDLWDEPDLLAGVDDVLSSLGGGGLGGLLRPGGLTNALSAATGSTHALPDPVLTWAIRGHHCVELEDGAEIWINDSGDVAQIRLALEEFDEDAVRSRFDPERMDAEEIDPEGWVSGGEQALDALVEAFRRLRGLYAEAPEAMTVAHL